MDAHVTPLYRELVIGARTAPLQAGSALARIPRTAPAAAGAFALLAAAAAADGGYFPGSWGWLTLACAWAAVLAVALTADASLPRAGALMLVCLAALTGWIALSALWSVDVTQTMLEARRALVYVSALLAALLVGRRSPGGLAAGAWAAIALVGTYSLLTRVVPDRLGVTDSISGYRLSEPIGYWNANGLLAGMGILLALGLAARGRPLALRAVAAASVVPLVVTLYFAFGRGPWVALGGGLLAMLALDRWRLKLAVAAAMIAPFAALAVWLSSSKPALTTTGSAFADIVAEGHALGPPLALLAAGAGVAALLLAWLERVVTVLERPRRIGVAALLAGAAVAAAVVFGIFGSPVSLAERGWDEFASRPPASSPDLNQRLFSLSGTGRVAQWQVAWGEARENPVLGTGAGTFERAWNRERAAPSKVRDAHNLYLETLSELGPLGLLLLAGALAVPLVAAVRARRSPLVSAAFGAYVAYLLHVTVDWDWELTAVTLAALVCAASIVCARGSPARLPAAGVYAAGAAVALLAIWGIAERTALSRIDSADDQAAARTASRLAPWSTEPWRVLAQAQIDFHRFGDARESLATALAKDDRDWRLWLQLARASDGRQRANALDTAERLNPYSPEVARYRALLVSLSGIAPP